MTSTRNRNDSLRDEVKRCPDYLYSYSPSGRSGETRYAFQIRTCLSLTEAVDYARQYGQRQNQSAGG